MKLIIPILLLAASVNAASLKLFWDTMPGASGYRMYIGTSPRTYAAVTHFSNAGTNTISGLQVGVLYYVAVTQLVISTGTNMLESEFSNEVSGVPRPDAPVLFLIITNTIQSSRSLQGPWKDETNMVATILAETNTFVRVKADIAKQ